MSELDSRQQRWNQRYQEKSFEAPCASFVLRANKHLLKSAGKALEIACGFGGNAIFLAKSGYVVDAVDYSEVALQKLADYAKENHLSINTQLADLEDADLDAGQYDVIVVSYYLQRDIFPKLFAALNPGGILFYQTFSGQCVDGAGPENPAFRLNQNELLTLCAGSSILYYREDDARCSGDECMHGEAMVVARRAESEEMNNE